MTSPLGPDARPTPAETPPADGLVHERIARHARVSPHTPALHSGAHGVGYGELDRRAAHVAAHLRACGVGPDVLVGVSIERSPATVVALLGILKAGGAYLPLDPAYPAERRALILEDAKPLLVLTSASLAEMERTPAPVAHGQAAGPRDLAYVIYTSGSTGRPKGVLLEHEGLRRRVETQLGTMGVGPGDRVLQFASLNFDASVFEMTLALCAGATLVLAPAHDLLPGPTLLGFLERERVSAALLPPSVLATLPDAPLPDLRLLMSGGEACTRAVVDRWARGRVFLNLYGPTEATIWATVDACAPGEDPTLGLPIDGATVHVLDQAQRPIRQGDVGELCIGGEGLARGYLGRPDLTAQAFVAGPEGARVYRTGDRARVRPDGRIEFLGRIDRQVKVRGVRVEPAEVEAALARDPQVRDAAVEPSPDAHGETRLVAYVVLDGVPAARPATAEELRGLRGSLAERLPDAMVPTVFVVLPALPLTPNGKVDRASLTHVVPTSTREDATPPRGEVERVLARLWAEELGVARVGPHDRLFDIGAHSLAVAKVQARLSQALGREVSALAFFEHPTVAALAAHLAQDEAPPEEGDARGAARRAALARGPRGRGIPVGDRREGA